MVWRPSSHCHAHPPLAVLLWSYKHNEHPHHAKSLWLAVQMYLFDFDSDSSFQNNMWLGRTNVYVASSHLQMSNFHVGQLHFSTTHNFSAMLHCQVPLVGTSHPFYLAPVPSESGMKVVIRRDKWFEGPAATVTRTHPLLFFSEATNTMSTLTMSSPFGWRFKCIFLTLNLIVLSKTRYD